MLPNLPINPCLIHWKEHRAHEWFFINEGGGHMLRSDFVRFEDPDHVMAFKCLGVRNVGTHRGRARMRWMSEDWGTWKPRHAGPYQFETEDDVLDLLSLDV